MHVSPQKPAVTRDVKVAICGNPNCGKTTIFNALTGLRQKVANYPGVTVEKVTGTFSIPESTDRRFTLVDIPGTYSLAAFSPDEYVAVRALCGSFENEEAPDVIVAIVDVTNLERSLYFLFQVLQVERPVIVALNMMDLAERRGMKVDTKKLSDLLGGVPVVPMVGSKGTGIDQLKSELANVNHVPSVAVSRFDEITENALGELIASSNGTQKTRSEWIRVLFDRSGPAERSYLLREGNEKISVLNSLRQRLIDHYGSLSAAETLPLSRKAAEIHEQVLTRRSTEATTTTERVDRVVLHPIAGPVIFLTMMILVFQAIFSWAEPFMGVIDKAFGGLGGIIEGSMADGPLRSLLVDGIVGGVGSVLVFLPQIIILFVFVSLLEDSGYMPRAAFLVDRLFGWCGLSGKSFIPMLSSFACAIPGIMATRTIEDKKLRFVTIMVSPLMSCSARLPVYTLMIAAFIPHETYFGIFNSQGLLLTGLYSIGILLAVTISFIVNRLILKSNRGTFMMEMPAYHVPTFKSVAIRIINRVQAFLTRAGTVIMAITIVIWAASYFPRSGDVQQTFDARAASLRAAYESQVNSMNTESARLPEATAIFESAASVDEIEVLRNQALGATRIDPAVIEQAVQLRTFEIQYDQTMQSLAAERAGAQLRASYFGRLGRLVEPVFEPLGWDWKITMATLASFPAREVIIATLGTIYNLGTEEDESSSSLIDKMRMATWDSGQKAGERVFTPAVAISIMVFFALCAQCGATLVTIRSETGRWWMAGLAFSYMTALAYIGAFVTYQVLNGIGV